MADGVGIAPTQPGGSLGFRDRGIATLPTIRNRQGWRDSHPRPPPSEGGRLLLTLHPVLRGNGAAGRTRTCISSFRRRMPRLFRPRQPKNWLDGVVDSWIDGTTDDYTNPVIQSSITPFRNGQCGRTCTCDPSVPSRACCCYTTR